MPHIGVNLTGFINPKLHQEGNYLISGKRVGLKVIVVDWRERYFVPSGRNTLITGFNYFVYVVPNIY